jgi:hypothetical protein
MTPYDSNPDERKDTNPPQILSPRSGDTTGLTFSVSGTYDGAGPVTVTVSCATPSSTTAIVTNGFWTAGPFTASMGGSCTVSANVGTGPSSSASFTVASSPVLDFDEAPVVEDNEPFPFDTVFVAGPKKKVTAKGKYVTDPMPVITGILQSHDGSYVQSLQVGTVHSDKSWKVTFRNVPNPGRYFVRVTMTSGGTDTMASRAVRVG